MLKQLEGIGEPSGLGSLAGEDEFYRAYAAQLKKVTDARYPMLAKPRVELVASLSWINKYLEMVFRDGTGFGHNEKQIPGMIEWMLFHGASIKWEVNFQNHYSVDDIRQLGVMLGKARFEIHGPEDIKRVEKEFLPILEKSVSRLKKAEGHLSERARFYVRSEFIRFLAGYLKL